MSFVTLRAKGKEGVFVFFSSVIQRAKLLVMKREGSRIFLFFVLLLTCGFFCLVYADISKIQNKSYYRIVRTASYKYHLPQSLILAVIRVESNFKTKAVSHMGAEGLMQLMPQTAGDLGVRDTFSVRQNILAGSLYLRKLIDNFDGRLELALAAYNAGEPIVKKLGKIPPYKETQNFVSQVLKYYKEYEDLS
ncbi:MAG: lytic transglycosylase domain-containing protein [Deltaproteobacteria bacterium]|nr:lytic transglycosylase domain-containing protein [Deltaproteobacteria bacterium]